jgi:isocitrate/isopropylmalate dehydrogenase
VQIPPWVRHDPPAGVTIRRVVRPIFDFLGEAAAGGAIVRAIESALEPGSDAPRTPDIGGKAGMAELGKAIAAAL